jgi:hypothetical protein
VESPPNHTQGVERKVGLVVLGLLAVGFVLLLLLRPGGHRPGAPAVVPSGSSAASVAAAIPDAAPVALDPAEASKLVRLSLDCVDRPYPYAPGAVLEADTPLEPPCQATPAFCGCFDWHSAVHGHWAMARILSRFPALPEADAIRAKLDDHLRPDKLARELAYLEQARNKGFERPYGWGWLLRLDAELHRSREPHAQAWAAAVDPLARLLAGRMSEYLPRLTVPVRAGAHGNTAFAMVHMLDYARAVGDAPFAQLLERRAREFYAADRGCPLAYEPSGEDFISPCLVEADLMRRVLAPAELASWLDGFLPALGSPELAPLLRPVEVRDRTDPRIGHLIGLELQRAAALEGLAAGLPASDPRAEAFRRLGRVHARAGIGQMFDAGYGGEHWLASFAVYLLTDVSGEAAAGTPPK